MKKIFFISGLTTIICLSMVFIGGFDYVLFDTLPIIFLVVLLLSVSGMLFVLVQNENKSYQYLPKFFVGSSLVSFFTSLIVQVMEFARSGYTDKIFSEFLFHNMINLVPLFLVFCFIGGLIGLVIRGVSSVFMSFMNKKERDSNFIQQSKNV